MFWIIVIIIVIMIAYLWLSFNPYARMVRTIQKLLNKDRTVCDIINFLNGWSINTTDKKGLRILIDPVVMPIYPLYITYNGHMPTKEELRKLCNALTGKESIVTKAHNMDMPVEQYIEMFGK